ncbi:hypothetical protein Pcinc_021049 [Petrolisthes cinctipes]|uniref:UDP-glucuronosyltransferase n=1 Tax=Petrolisthes cinctipes TaxID=88211 RepID=A0AAE1KIY3_PETCI|nr:hypothetical protein Pcinc_021049 [Petrolisthes cinctipes]
MDMFAMRGGEQHALKDIVLGMPEVARKLYSDPQVMEIWHGRHQYDAIIINSAINEMAFPFLLDVNVPFITFSPTGTEPLQLSYLGNMVSPAALPSVILPYHDSHDTVGTTGEYTDNPWPFAMCYDVD